jgi:glycosyltransferase involved in cell wall biosynthesis
MGAQDAPLVSIVLPTYNRVSYLAESIQSCLDQTYPHWELIVVDDASTDGTADALTAFSARDPRIRVIRHETNRRLPAALNTGFALAQGEYLTWTSDDDRFHPCFLEKLVHLLQTRAEIDFVYTDIEILDVQGRVVRREPAMEPEQLITGFDGAGITSFLYRRRVYECVGDYAEDLFLAEDYDYWVRALVHRMCMYHLRETLYQYRRHPQSLTDTHRGKTFFAAEQTLLRQLPNIPSLSRSTRGQAYLYLASLAAWRGDSRVALGYTLRALPRAPNHTFAKLLTFACKRMRHRLG